MKYQICWIDSDTILYSSAACLQQNYIIVTHKPSEKKKRFKGKEEFKGLTRKSVGGWLGQVNKEREEKGQEPFQLEDFNIEECAELHPDYTTEEQAVEAGLTMIDIKVGAIKKVMKASDYRLCIGGETNFRKECAQQVAYKSNRTEKPIFFAQLREAFIEKYKSKIVITEGIEAEDYVSIRMAEAFEHYKKHKVWKYSFSAVDKDLNQVIGPNINYNRLEEGYTVNKPLDCAKSLAKQMLIGDVTDAIPKLPNMTEEMCIKYGLRRTRGVGEATANELINPCETPKEAFERVVDCYKSYYGEEKKKFVTWRGEEVMWNWLDYLQDNARLLYLLRKEGEVYHITQTLDKLGIEY